MYSLQSLVATPLTAPLMPPSPSRWWDPQELRFSDDEPARHKVADLIGDLALSAAPGSAGLPVGHVVAFNADHDLTLRHA